LDYDVYEWAGGDSALRVHADTHRQLFEILDAFSLREDHFRPDPRRMNRSLIAEELQAEFRKRQWRTEVKLGNHQVDCAKGPVAVEIEWHSKDLSFGRDVLNFNRLRLAGVIDVAVIITRDESLRARFRLSGKRDYASTSHISKLVALMAEATDVDCPLVGVALKS
jgi:restriction endonuclease BglII